jgi:hypothetical protein
MRFIAFIVTVLSVIPSPSQATPLAPKAEDVCTRTGGSNVVDPKKLVGYLFKTQGVHDLDLDTTGNDVVFDTKVAALAGFDKFCTGAHCSDQARAKLAQASFALLDFFRTYSRPLPPDQSGFQMQPPIGRAGKL